MGNLITAIMLNQPNTIYEIRYDFDLNGETIKIPEGCTLKFEGGSLKNGTLSGNVIEEGYGFTDCNITNCNVNLNVSLYINENSKFNSNNLNRIFEVAKNVDGICYFKEYRTIYITKDVYVYSNSEIDFSNTVIYNDLYAIIMNIGNAKKTYKDENISLRNMYVHSGSEYAARANIFCFRGVKGLRLENITYIDAVNKYTESHWFAAWCFSISGIDIYMKNIYIDNYKGGMWYDGIHFEFVKNVILDNFNIYSGDDCVAIHPQWQPPFANDINIPNCSENVVIRNGECKSRIANSIRIGYKLSKENNPNFYISTILIENITQNPGETSKFTETYRMDESSSNLESNLNNKISNITFKNVYAFIQRNTNSRTKWMYNENLRFYNCVFDLGNSPFSISADSLIMENCFFYSNTFDITNKNKIEATTALIKDCFFYANSGLNCDAKSGEVSSIDFTGNHFTTTILLVKNFDKLVFNNNIAQMSKSSFDFQNIDTVFFVNNYCTFDNVSVVISCSSIKEGRGKSLIFANNTIVNKKNKMSYLILVFDNNKYDYGRFMNNLIDIDEYSFSYLDFATTIDYDNTLPYEMPQSVGNSIKSNGCIKILESKPYIYSNGWKPLHTTENVTSDTRPTNAIVGSQYFDTVLNKPIWWNGSSWVGANGTSV